MPIETVKRKEQNPYQEWSATDAAGALSKYDFVSHGSTNNEPTRRAPFDHREFERWRPADSTPTEFPAIVKSCRLAYYRFGIIRNVIDLMTDFVCEDFRIVHPNKSQEALIKAWCAKVNIYEVINEFVRHLLIDSNVVVKRTTATLTKPVQNQWTKTAMAASDVKLYVENTDVEQQEIPWRYTFMNILALEWMNTQAEELIQGPKLGYKVNSAILGRLRSNPKALSPIENSLISQLPQEAKNVVVNRKGDTIPLDMTRIYIAHNKKDSWDRWAMPFLYSVLGDLHYKNKMRQAEISALDGVINVIRLWKLGDHEQTPRILPTSAGVTKLLDILSANPGGGAIDIVWDSMIDMKEFYPPIDKILGSEKYTQVNSDILIGLGVPEVLLGGPGANFSNSFIQLKTLTEKLKYLRQIVKNWIYHEIMIFCQGMGIETAPKIKFGQLLDDEATTKKLIVGLLDRGIISAEAVLNVYGEDFVLEMERIKEEKGFLKDAGVKVKSPLDQKPLTKPAGRPPVSKDSGNRKTRQAKPRTTKANYNLTIKALEVIKAIDGYLVPLYMKEANVSNARKLTSDQKEELNGIRLSVLSCIKPTDELSEGNLLSLAQDSDKIDEKFIIKANKAISGFIARHETEPTLDQRKVIEALAWATYNGEKDA